jgi:hypothetical protein
MEIGYHQYDLIYWIKLLYEVDEGYSGKTVGDALARMKELAITEPRDKEYFSQFEDEAGWYIQTEANLEAYRSRELTFEDYITHKLPLSALINWLELEPEIHDFNITNVETSDGLWVMTLCDDLKSPKNVYTLIDHNIVGGYNSNLTDKYFPEINAFLDKYIKSLPESYGNNINLIAHEAMASNALYLKIKSDRIGMVNAVNGRELHSSLTTEYAKELDFVKGYLREYTSEVQNEDISYINMAPYGSVYTSDLMYAAWNGDINEYNEAKARLQYVPNGILTQGSLFPNFQILGDKASVSESRAVTHGMSLESAEQLIAKMLENADKIRNVLTSTATTLGSTSWLGPDIQDFKEKWQGLFAKQLQLAATALVDSSEVVKANRKEQEEASV